MTTVAILQSSYIPWKGYFDIIQTVDLFVFLEDVQYTRRDWRNRNRIKTAQGPRWLSIPVHNRQHYQQTLGDTRIADPGWSERHWRSLQDAYRRAPCFAEIAPLVRDWYAQAAELERLSQVNMLFIRKICELLGIETEFLDSRELAVPGRRDDRLVAICRQLRADLYLSGPAARAYIAPEKFAQAGIELCYANYDGYPEYPQLHGAFEHQLSILDMLFNLGRQTRRYMKGFPESLAQLPLIDGASR